MRILPKIVGNEKETNDSGYKQRRDCKLTVVSSFFFVVHVQLVPNRISPSLEYRLLQMKLLLQRMLLLSHQHRPLQGLPLCMPATPWPNSPIHQAPRPQRQQRISFQRRMHNHKHHNNFSQVWPRCRDNTNCPDWVAIRNVCNAPFVGPKPSRVPDMKLMSLPFAWWFCSFSSFGPSFGYPSSCQAARRRSISARIVIKKYVYKVNQYVYWLLLARPRCCFAFVLNGENATKTPLTPNLMFSHLSLYNKHTHTKSAQLGTTPACEDCCN
jgi:hypothetical protein